LSRSRALIPATALLLLVLSLSALSCAQGKTVEVETYRESPPIVGAARKSAYSRPDGSAPFPETAPLMVLRGTWSGMGEEYGRRAAVEIRQVYEGLFQRLEEAGMDERSLLSGLERYRQAIEGLSPEILEFMQGIADGSSPQLQDSASGEGLGATDRILLINFFASLYAGAPGSGGEQEEEGSAWECRGTLVGGGNPLAGANIDGTFYPFMYRLALIVIPDDPESSVYFSLPVAGSVGGPVGINAEGVTVTALPVKVPETAPVIEGTAGSETDNINPALLPPSMMSTMALMGSRDTRSAINTLLYGPGSLSISTEHADLIGCLDAVFLVSDAKTAEVLERDPTRYGIREEEPADIGGSFVVCSDNFSAPDSFDAGGQPLGQAMSAYDPSAPDIAGSVVRQRSLTWLLRRAAGNIDASWLVANACGMNYIYDEQGKKSYQVENALGDTVSCFESGLTVDRYVARGNSPYFGTVCSSVVDPASLNVWYELGLPSDWVGAWEHLDLGDYSR
jgi:hypothetical protein